MTGKKGTISRDVKDTRTIGWISMEFAKSIANGVNAENNRPKISAIPIVSARKRVGKISEL